MKRIAILGSTGSVGQSTLSVIRQFPDKFLVEALSTCNNATLLSEQINKFNPKNAVIVNETKKIKNNFSNTKIYFGKDNLKKIVIDKNIDLVVIAISGAAALIPLIEAIKHKKTIALANKESLVMAGHIVIKMAKENKVKIIPIDSEQSAIWQCLEGNNKKDISKIYLTASGGPLNNVSLKNFRNLSKNKILNHPRWKMGRKITVDSATLMNKGLEVIETKWLFGIDLDSINVLIHPEAIIHSMVEFCDGSLMAQLSNTDMRFPIQYALTYPERYRSNFKKLDFLKIKSLNFKKPDFKKFPCLGLAYQVARDGGSMPCVLNASNEEAVDAFLNDNLKFIHIPKVVEKILSKHKKISNPNLNEILEIDKWARHRTKEYINQLN
ncbi:MAG: 1-deoxy-D-xylulose-5-phosphate reductoisomerase [Candidatus Omnitrophota bacterium]